MRYALRVLDDDNEPDQALGLFVEEQYMAGLYFEELTVGRRFEHALTRSVTESDNMLFCGMTMNPQPLHVDRHFAAGTEFGQPLVNSLLTLGLMIGISVHETTLGTTVANLGMSDTRFAAPLFHGDTISVTSEVAEARRSRSRPGVGIVTFDHRAFNQHGIEVAACRRQAMMRCRDGGAAS